MIETCGSYRRLKPSCGDIDMLITFKDGKRHLYGNILAPLIDKLKEIGNNLTKGKLDQMKNNFLFIKKDF